ncbi:hypothetical protein [Listeria phage vB_Lmo_C2]
MLDLFIWNKYYINIKLFKLNREVMIMSNLKNLRKQKGVTMVHMAKLLGYKSVSSYQKIEEGKTALKADQLMVIAKEFNVEPEKILDQIYSY